MTTNTVGWPKAGDKVLIFTSDREEDPNEYKVNCLDGRVMILQGSAGVSIKVNTSRLRQIMTTETASAPVEVVKETTPVTTATKPKPPKPAKAETKAEPKKKVTIGAKAAPAKKPKTVLDSAAPLDINELVKAGHEVWTKVCKFNHKSVVARSHIMFAPDHKSYVAFNTYNGTMSAKRKKNVKLNKFKVEGGAAGLDKKRQELTQEGYVLHANSK